ncbi:MAG: T9SS type A sorting domain-containing protein, partial [Marinilabiliaceae bacterium]|nr:T9SS type A sorting domain-containing protein [Marinilabiliaceae bacterium]
EYHFVEWTGDITSTNAAETFTMDGNKTITANFALLNNITKIESDLVNIYPNPFRNSITIKSESEIESVVIYDLSGKTLINNQLAKQNTINTNSLSKGVYLIEIKMRNGKINTKKIVKK